MNGEAQTKDGVKQDGSAPLLCELLVRRSQALDELVKLFRCAALVKDFLVEHFPALLLVSIIQRL